MTTSTARARFDAHAAKLDTLPVADLLAMHHILDAQVTELRAAGKASGDYRQAQAANMTSVAVADAITRRHPEIDADLEKWAGDVDDAQTYDQALTYAVLARGIITRRRLDDAIRSMTAAMRLVGLI